MANPLYPPNALSGNSDCLNEEAVAKFLCNGFCPILMLWLFKYDLLTPGFGWHSQSKEINSLSRAK